MIDKMGSTFKEYAPFVLRVGLATIFIILGARHLTSLGGSPSAGEIVSAVVEILGGLFVLIGFLTRWAAAALVVLVIVEIAHRHHFRAFVEESRQLWFATLVMGVALYFLGGGKWSVDASNRRKKEEG